jgi:hypothetical protein
MHSKFQIILRTSAGSFTNKLLKSHLFTSIMLFYINHVKLWI